MDLGPVVERTIYGARISLRLGAHVDLWHPLPLAFMTQRCRLDSYLASLAAQAGAEIHDGEPAVALKWDGAKVEVRTNKNTYYSPIVVGADGANGLASRILGARQTFEEAVALEGNVPFPPQAAQEWQEVIALDLGGISGGYGWVFPKGDHLNIGVGGWKYAARLLRPGLQSLCARYDLRFHRLENLRGYHLPLRRPYSPLVGRGILLVGDAAGLVDPLSGEGIHMAFVSASLAAEAIGAYLEGKACCLSSYVQAISRHVAPELEISRQLHELFHLAPPPYVLLLQRSRHFWRLFCHLIRGEIDYRGLMRLLGPLAYLVKYFSHLAQARRQNRLRLLGLLP